MRILRGVAIETYGNSYLDRYQRVAELESNLKVKRLERDLPKFSRTQDEWISSLTNKKQEES